MGTNNACGNLGTLYSNGLGVKQNYNMAAKLYKKACGRLGALLLELKSEKNYKKVASLLQTTCDKNDFLSCSTLGTMYVNGDGVRQDYVKAADFFQKACNGGIASGCGNMGIIYYNGEGVRQNAKLAKEYFGKACDLGEQRGCKAYKELNSMGH